MADQRPDWLDDELNTPQTATIIRVLADRGLRIGVAESLTGGLLMAELIRPPGASEAVLGGAVAYATPLKRDLLGVDAGLLEREGPVHPEVARQMARGVRDLVAVDGRSAEVGVSTTGVAGPDPQGGRAPGTVFIGISIGDESVGYGLVLEGGRDRIRTSTVAAALRMLAAHLGL